MYKFKFFRNFESFFSFKNQFKREGRESARVGGWRSLPVCGAVVVRYNERGCCRLERAWGCGKFARVVLGYGGENLGGRGKSLLYIDVKLSPCNYSEKFIFYRV